jgi:excisionase family DNA binding protein
MDGGSQLTLEPQQLLTPEEAAQYLRLNLVTVYRLLQRGLLPGAKVGHQWRIKQLDLDRFLTGDAQKEAAAAEKRLTSA